MRPPWAFPRLRPDSRKRPGSRYSGLCNAHCAQHRRAPLLPQRASRYCCDNHGIHTVQDTFCCGWLPGMDQPQRRPRQRSHHPALLGGVITEGHLGEGDGTLGTRQTAIGKVGEDPQMDAAPVDSLDARRQTLGCGVDGIGTHGVAQRRRSGVERGMVLSGFFDQAHFKVSRPAT